MLFVEYKTKKVIVLIHPDITDFDSVLARFQPHLQTHAPMLITYNNQQNVESLYQNWKKAVAFHINFQIMFVNPCSLRDTKWIIYPHTHNNITEPAALKKGLLSMYTMVDPLSFDHQDEF